MTLTVISPAQARMLTAVMVPLLALVALLSWATASPVGASPDDDFHLASIWCGDGLRAGLCETGPSEAERVVPESVTTSACYAFKPTETASCQGGDIASSVTTMIATGRGNWTGAYPPLFYSVMGMFAGPNITISVLLMRAFNALLFVAFTTALFWLLPPARRPLLPIALVVSVVPLGMFLIPSTNPGSWAILSAGTLWISLLGYFETHGRRRLGLGLLAAAATVIGSAARADAALYAVLAIGIVVLIAARRTRRFLVSLSLPVALALTAAFFYFSSGQSSFAESGLASNASGSDWQQLLFVNVLDVPQLWAGALGFWGLGWLDTTLPGVVWVLAVSVFSATVFTGLQSTSWRKGLATSAVFGMMWAIPTYVLVRSRAFVGEQVQPRYILPLMILLAGITLLQPAGRAFALGRVQAVLIVVGLGVANSVALHVNLRRYVTGTDAIGWNLNAGLEWWWGVGPAPMAVWIVGTAAFAGVAAGLLVLTQSRTSAPSRYSPPPARTTGR
ncbi:DUF2142 domain-containing protein [Cryobacterium sp. GrIS_2_6]|uniref:DUF2142 domain-containing protein n=1 Tax=Cryobacterium sp. GrIS_2_6 TaxID=3162785 RepID=UPI002E00F126|nr:hypothetical protein [Cryobacterium psychrotolerans]